MSCHLLSQIVYEKLTSTTGIGTLSLAGPTVQCRTFVNGIGTGNTCDYCLLSANGVDFEIGTGTVTSGSPDTLTRTSVYSSTNSGSKISLSAGTHTVFLTSAANHAVHSIDLDNAFGSTQGLVLYRGASSWTASKAAYGLSFSAPQITQYTASQVVGHHPFSVAVTIPANFGSFNGRTSRAGGTVNATSSTVVSVEKAVAASSNTFSQIGTITFASSSVTATFATASGVDQTFAVGDVLRLVMPSPADATFVGFYCNIVGHET